MLIKSGDPKAVLTPYQSELKSAISRVVESGCYIGGEEVAGFEQEFSEYLNTKHVISAGSGTDALQLALRALGVKKGDKVATVSHTAVATIAAIEISGAVPVFVDIDPDTFTISTDSLQKTLEYHRSLFPKDPVKAVIPVHLYGHPADMYEIMRLSDEFNVSVIEDCAQAHGASIGNHKCGSFGHAAAYSFYPTKNLGCLGDGGAMCTNLPEIAERARLIKEYGWKERYISKIPGINTRLDSIQAAILRIRLKYLDGENEKRINSSGRYKKEIVNNLIELPCVREDYHHVYHQYVIKTKHRNGIIAQLNKKGICTSIHYPLPVHLQPAYKDRIHIEKNSLSVTERICNEILSLPIQPSLTEKNIDYIINSLNNCM